MSGLFHLHRWGRWEFLRNVDVYDEDDTRMPVKRLAFYEKRCEKCGYPKTRRVRA